MIFYQNKKLGIILKVSKIQSKCQNKLINPQLFHIKSNLSTLYKHLTLIRKGTLTK